MLGRSLLMKASGARLLYPGYVQVLLDRVTAADVGAGNTQGLEVGVTDAISTCVQTLVADGILGVSGGALSQAASLIKAACVMQGARTLPGALVPLAADMPAPTNLNFVAGDYNRRTGLGDLTNASKYLNTNRNNNADPQDSKHVSIYASSLPTMPSNGSRPILGMSRIATAGNGASLIYDSLTRLHDTASSTYTASVGFIGISRNSSASYARRNNGADQTLTEASTAPLSGSIALYADLVAVTPLYSNARLSFYSIGSALDLAILDARITALSNAIQAAIAP